jgi:hypothetical protein
LTVVVCTHNRVAYLRRALESLAAQSLDPGALDVVVVDNGSSDGTALYLDDAVRCGARLQVVREDELGLSHARNAGIAVAQTPWIAFLDDDAVAARRWAEGIVARFATAPTRIGAVGGPIAPLWEGPRPAWLTDYLLGYYSVLDLGDTAHAMGPDRIVFGGNAAYSAGALRAVGGFDVELGRKGANSLLSNEELSLQRCIDGLGLERWYDPRVRIDHPVHAERVNQRWLLRRAYWQGASDAVATVSRDRYGAPRRAAIAMWKAASTGGLAGHWIRAIGVTGPGRAAEARAALMRRLGYAAAMVGLAR